MKWIKGLLVCFLLLGCQSQTTTNKETTDTKEEVTEAVRVIYTAGGLPSLIENFDLYREVLL